MAGENDDSLGEVVRKQLNGKMTDNPAFSYTSGALPELLFEGRKGKSCIQANSFLHLVGLQFGLLDSHIRL